MIAWVARANTPQFAPVLNRLYEDCGLPIVAYYMYREAGRGWGDLDTRHPHRFVLSRGHVRDLWDGFALSQSPDLDAAVVFGYSGGFPQGLLFGCRLRGIPVFTQSDSDYDQHMEHNAAFRLAKRVVLGVLYSPKTRVWAVGQSNALYWRAHGLTNQRLVPFESPLPDGCTHQRDSRQRTVLYVGRVSPEKRVEDLLVAVRIMRDKGLPVRLSIVGPGQAEDPVYRSALAEPWVDVHGGVAHKHLATHYLSADVLALPSERDRYGLVVREALQFGLPVVASSIVPAARELCDFGWNIVPPRDPAALATALERAVTSEPRWSARPPIDTSRTYYEELAGIPT